MDMPVTAPEVPPGFREIPTVKYAHINGPLYGRLVDGKFTLGFRVEERHCNPWNTCHGGMLMTLADMTLSLGANLQEKLYRFLPTVKLEGDYLAPAEIGAWLEGDCEVLRVTRNLVFTQGLIRAGDRPIMRASAIMKLPPEPDPRFAFHKVFM
jgi:uncharacterized protein (TIGR00369 family)